MVVPLTIPRRYQSGLAKIRDLDDNSVDELRAALQRAPSSINANALASAVAAMVDTIAVSDVEEIVPALLHYYAIRDAWQWSAEKTAEGIVRGMEEIASEQLRSSPEDREPFQARLLELLNLDSLYAIARAARLSVENEHSLRETRIVTDIRPVFEADRPDASPTGAVIVHTLRITYFLNDNETRSFFVALDTNDVRELSEQLARANLKAESIKSVLEAAKVPYIDAD
jgi:hypothetical protein